jgi:PUA domain protein
MSRSQRGLRIASRYLLSKRDRRKVEDEVLREVGGEYAQRAREADRVEIALVKHSEVSEAYFLDGTLALVRTMGAGLIPSLYFMYKNNVYPSYPSVYVDAGAVPRILNGADVMVPGIKKVEGEFSPNAKVLVRELEKGRVIAVGVSLMSSQEIRTSGKGKAVKSLHYLGDEIWEASVEA